MTIGKAFEALPYRREKRTENPPVDSYTQVWYNARERDGEIISMQKGDWEVIHETNKQFLRSRLLWRRLHRLIRPGVDFAPRSDGHRFQRLGVSRQIPALVHPGGSGSPDRRSLRRP